MIEAVFFDLANTLLHKPDFYETVCRVLRQHAIEMDKKELEKRHRLLSEVVEFPDHTSKEFYLTFNTQLLYSLGINPSSQLLDDIFASCSYLPWQPFEDTGFLKEIKVPLGIISNWDASIHDRLDGLQVSFSWILGSGNEKIRKPDPAFYRKMMERTELDAGQILYIGDSVRLDIAPALKLGIQAVLIDRPGLYPVSNLDRITRLDEIIRYL